MDLEQEKAMHQLYSMISDGTKLGFTELLKFCSRVRLYPDLLSLTELKKILMMVAGRNNPKPTLTCNQFKQLLILISDVYFEGTRESSKVQILIDHISSPCILHYSVDLTPAKKKLEFRKNSSAVDIELSPLGPLTSRLDTNRNSSRNRKKESLSSLKSSHFNPTPRTKVRKSSMISPRPGFIIQDRSVEPKTLPSTTDSIKEESKVTSYLRSLKKNKSSIALKLSDLASPTRDQSATQTHKGVPRSKFDLDKIAEALSRFKNRMENAGSVPILGQLSQKAIRNITQRRVTNRFALQSAFKVWNLTVKLAKVSERN
jgi:hypothetical protein